MTFSSTSSTNVQRCLCPLFQNKRTRVLLPPLFRKISKPSGQGQQNGKPHTIDCHPSPSELTSMIHPLIFLWILKRLISLGYFLNFFSNLYIPSWLQKSFKFMVLRLLGDTYVSRNLTMNLINFAHAPKQNSPPGRRELPISPGQLFLKIYFSPSRKSEDYGAEKMAKIELERVLVTSFDKFHHICNLYCFGLFSCAIIQIQAC